MFEILGRRSLRTALLLATAILLPGCAGTSSTVGDEPGAAAATADPDQPRAPHVSEADPTRTATPGHPSEAVDQEGQALFESVCGQCHTVSPPAGQAPPMAMVTRHYREVYGDRDAVRQAVIRWVTEPDAERSALPAHAIERFGLMPAQPLPPEQLGRVVDYVLTLEATPGPRSSGMGMRMRMRHGARGGPRGGMGARMDAEGGMGQGMAGAGRGPQGHGAAGAMRGGGACMRGAGGSGGSPSGAPGDA
jgi:mono/diheme cytochrome c family protein